MREFSGLDEFKAPQDALKSIVPNWLEMTSAFLLMAYTPKNSIGRRFINFIKENNLGTITESGIKLDKASGKRVRAFFWGVNTPAASKWFLDSFPPNLKIGDLVIANVVANDYGYNTTKPGTVWEVVNFNPGQTRLMIRPQDNKTHPGWSVVGVAFDKYNG